LRVELDVGIDRGRRVWSRRPRSPAAHRITWCRYWASGAAEGCRPDPGGTFEALRWFRWRWCSLSNRLAQMW